MPDTRVTLANELARHRGIASAYLFGSAAEGRAHRDSDVDVGILLDRAVYPLAADRFELRIRLLAQLQPAVGRDVDIVILNDAPPQFARHITTRGQRLVLVDPEADHVFRRITLLRAADIAPFLRRTRRIKLETLVR